MLHVNSPCYKDPSYALIKATTKGNLHNVICAIENGAKLAVNQNGHTALHIASFKGFLDIVRVLLNCGCDLDIPDDHGDTALHRACIGGHDHVVKRLLDEGCCVNRQNEFGYTGLHEAAYRGFSRTVNHLINAKANINCKTKHGDTPIHLAAANGHSGSLRLLLSNNSNSSPMNMRKETPLHLSVKFNHVTCSRVLITAKCLVDAKDENGNTALHLAAISKNKKLCRVLLDSGANTSLCNNENETALDIARKCDQVGELIYILISGPRPAKSRCRSLRRSHSKKRSKSETRCIEERKKPISSMKEHHKLTKIELQKRPKSATLPRKVYHQRSKCQGMHTTASNENILENCQKQIEVQPYIVPQLYSLYRDKDGTVQQKPVLTTLPNPTPEIVSNLSKEVETTKDQLLKEISQKTGSLSNKLNRLSEKTEHKFNKLDKLTSQRIKAERSQCLHRIDRRATLERTISEKIVSENLKSWLDRKKMLLQDSFDKDNKHNLSSSNSETEEPGFSGYLPPKFCEATTSANMTDSAYDSFPQGKAVPLNKPYKYGNSFPRMKRFENTNIPGPASPTRPSYEDLNDLTAHVTMQLFENVSSAMEQWYERRLKNITQKQNEDLKKRVAALEKQLEQANLDCSKPNEHLV